MSLAHNQFQASHWAGSFTQSCCGDMTFPCPPHSHSFTLVLIGLLNIQNVLAAAMPQTPPPNGETPPISPPHIIENNQRSHFIIIAGATALPGIKTSHARSGTLSPMLKLHVARLLIIVHNLTSHHLNFFLSMPLMCML